MRVDTPESKLHPEEMEEIVLEDDEHKNNNRPRAGTEDSVESDNSTTLHSATTRPSLADAWKNGGEFHFDMSDRWRIALMESMDQPMFPEGFHPNEPRRNRLRKGVTNFVKKRAQGLRESRRNVHHHPPAPAESPSP